LNKDPFEPSLLEQWNRGKHAFLTLGALVLILFAVLYFALRARESDPVFEEATVLSFGTYADYDGNHPTVKIRQVDGTVRDIAV